MKTSKALKRFRRKVRVRKSIESNEQRPRLSVYRSHGNIYAQLVDDTKGHTIASASDLQDKSIKGTKTARAHEVGKAVAQKAQAQGIDTIVFDRNGFIYTGRIRSLADGAREGGLKF